jgi:hypothetical protein
VQYAQQLTATGGTAPYTWSLAGGVLPGAPGELTLAPSGLLSGTSSIEDAQEFVVKVTDANGSVDTKSICLHLLAAPDANISTRTLNSPDGPTLGDLITTILGGGVAYSNVTITGPSAAAGTFQGGTNALGFDTGIVLSSGAVANLGSANTADNITTAFGGAGDGTLDALSGKVTRDAMVIEFDFVPTTDQITFDYVFGSDEYNEYVNTDFNDVFAFVVNGVNYARVPGTATPVAINTINGGNPYNPLGPTATNPSFFRNNDLSDGGGLVPIESDGVTVVLTLAAPVIPNVTNHIKLAIADATDFSFDSWVFIKGGSFRAVENCSNGVDDDNDDRIDAADPDCVCQDVHPPVVIIGGGAAPHAISAEGQPAARRHVNGPGASVSAGNQEAAGSASSAASDLLIAQPFPAGTSRHPLTGISLLPLGDGFRRTGVFHGTAGDSTEPVPVPEVPPDWGLQYPVGAALEERPAASRR